MAASTDFFLAVNYPWLRYGLDFGRSPWGYTGIGLEQSQATVAADFGRMASAGVSVVRWFLLGDGRSGIRYENGIPVAPDDLLFTDVRAALGLASQANLRICFSLFDFLWLETQDAGGAPDFPGRQALQFTGGRVALLERVLVPLFREFRGHPALFAWEIVNEPEWAIPEFRPSARATLPFAEAHAFFAEIALAIREEAGGIPSTLGSARLGWLRAWSEIGLDLVEAHYYPQLEKEEGLSLREQLARARDVPQPLWVGELPASDPGAPDYSLPAALSACREAGAAGAGVWRWREPEASGSDRAFGRVEAETLLAWRSRSAEFRV